MKAELRKNLFVSPDVCIVKTGKVCAVSTVLIDIYDCSPSNVSSQVTSTKPQFNSPLFPDTI